MKWFTCFFFLFVPLAAASLFAGGKGEFSETAQVTTTGTIRKAGVIRVGIHFDMPKMGLVDKESGGYSGYEVEIARLLARDLLGGEDKVEFIGVTNEEREIFLDTRKVDVIIATFGKTENRVENYNVSSPYYVDFAGLMVRKESAFRGLTDLNGRSIGVIRGTNTRQAINAAAAAIGVQPHFYEFARFSEIKAALDAGLLDVFASDRTVLARYIDDTTAILPDRFAPREYGIATRLSNTELAAFIERRVQQWQKEQALEGLQAYFGL
jgi:putative glutamine transport system substrate-binding protein